MKAKSRMKTRSKSKTRTNTRTKLSRKVTKMNSKKNNLKKNKLSRKRQVDGNYKIKKRKQLWTIYGLQGCPYCDDAKKLLKERKIRFHYKIFADLQPEEQKRIEDDIKKYRKKEDNKKTEECSSSGCSIGKCQKPTKGSKFGMTFPRIFDDKGNFRGGYNDVESGVTYLKEDSLI